MAIKVAIDAGHGFDTAGKRSCPFVRDISHTFEGRIINVKKGEQFREHVGNAGVSAYLEKELKRCGFEVFKSGWNDADGTNDKQLGSDPTKDVIARQTNIRNAKCDYSISVHFNASGDGKTFNSSQGIETYYHSVASKLKDGKAMATAVHAELAKVFTAQKNRGAKAGDFGMCNATGMNVKAAVLCELSFMTNQFEAENYFTNPEAWKKYAVAIAKGFCAYVGVKYVAENPSVSTTSGSIKAGDRVSIVPGAVYGGAAFGKPVPAKFTNGSKYTVDKVQKNNGQNEARLKELVSWVALKYLKK